jgi:hypothetical protein
LGIKANFISFFCYGRPMVENFFLRELFSSVYVKDAIKREYDALSDIFVTQVIIGPS